MESLIPGFGFLTTKNVISLQTYDITATMMIA